MEKGKKEVEEGKIEEETKENIKKQKDAKNPSNFGATKSKTASTRRKEQDFVGIQNKQLKKILIVFGAIIVVFLLGFAVIDSIRHPEYKGVKFDAEKYGKIMVYKTAFPIYSSITGKHVVDYNIYLRNDPRKLENIPFDGDMELDIPLKKMVIELEKEFNCEGKGIIAIANFVKAFDLIGIEVVKDPEVGCDAQGRYMYVKLREGNETSIEQFGPACYNINIKDCEVLEGTERFTIEAFAEFGDKRIYYNVEN